MSRYSTDQATVDKALADIIAQVQQIKSADGTMPAIIAEYGNSTDGTSIDANGVQVVTSVVNLGGQGKVGSAAWHWNPGGNADHLMEGNQPSSPYGQMVQLYINTDVVPLSGCQMAQASQAAIVAAAVTASTPATPDSPSDPTTDQTDDPAVATATTSARTAQQSMTATDAHISAAQAAVTQANAGLTAAQSALGSK